jgi:hypothetical protein
MQPPNHQILGCCIDQLRAPFSLQTVPAREEEPRQGVAQYAGFMRGLELKPSSEGSSRDSPGM